MNLRKLNNQNFDSKKAHNEAYKNGLKNKFSLKKVFFILFNFFLAIVIHTILYKSCEYIIRY